MMPRDLSKQFYRRGRTMQNTKPAESKYHREIVSCLDDGVTCVVDVYAVLEAFGVNCPARQHAIKKLLCAGLRGKCDEATDLKEAALSIARAIAMQEARK